MDVINPDYCDTRTVVEWLIDGARSAPEPHQVLAEGSERLCPCGIPLWRSRYSCARCIRTFRGAHSCGGRGEAVQIRPANFGLFESEEFRNTCGKYFFGYPKKPGASPLADQCIKVRTVP